MCIKICINVIHKFFSSVWFFTIGNWSQNFIKFNIVFTRCVYTPILTTTPIKISRRHVCYEKNLNGVHIISVLRVMGSRLDSWLLFVYTELVGSKTSEMGSPLAIHAGVRHWAWYVIPANYLLRYFYIQYIRERRLVGTPSNPTGHTGDPSWEWRNPT